MILGLLMLDPLLFGFSVKAWPTKQATSSALVLQLVVLVVCFFQLIKLSLVVTFGFLNEAGIRVDKRGIHLIINFNFTQLLALKKASYSSSVIGLASAVASSMFIASTSSRTFFRK